MKNITKFLFFILCSLFINLGFAAPSGGGTDETFFYCGPGYVLAPTAKTNGIDTYECQKLWCRDLENGKTMGTKNAAASGYKITSAPIELCDAEGTCAGCFGDRKWCAGVPAGAWNPDYGAYTRGGADSATYGSYQKGNCFTWRLEKIKCAPGETSILQKGKWVCITPAVKKAVKQPTIVTKKVPLKRMSR